MNERSENLWIEAMKRFFQRKSGNWIVNREEVKKYQFDPSIPFHVCEFLSSYKNEERHFSSSHLKLLQEEILQYRPAANQIQEFKHKLMTLGKYKLLENLDVEARLSKNDFVSKLNSINELAVIDPTVIESNPMLLNRSVWGLCQIEYDGQEESRQARGAERIRVVNFIPIETSGVSPRAVKEAFSSIGEQYGSDQCLQIWAEIMLATLGHRPSHFDLQNEEGFKKYLTHLTRLVPLVVDNVFLIETGNPGNGKTTAANRSAYSHAVPINVVSMAKIFFHSGTRQPGVIQGLDYLAFDDVQASGGWRNIDSLSATLLGFMNNSTIGQVTVPPSYRGNSGCSISFLGNTRGESCLKNPNQYFANVPESMRQNQFLDRINAYIDGHEIEKFDSPWGGEALQADIFNRFLYELRRNRNLRLDFSRWFGDEYVELKNVGARCRHSIQTISTGLLLLAFPQYTNIKGTRRMEQPDAELLRIILKHAIELRQNVRFLISRSGSYQPDLTANYNEPISFFDKWS